MNKPTFIILTGALVAAGSGPGMDSLNAADEVRPPVAKKVSHVRELHGDRFDDEYFWLREKSSPRS